MIILGQSKIGKSSFCAGAPDVVFLPIAKEEGIDSLKVAKFPVINSFTEFMDALRVLAEEDHNFKYVAIDSASALEPLIYKDVCDEYGVANIELVLGGWGKGFTFALDRWEKVMAALDYLRDEKDMGCFLIGHVIVKRFDDPERASYDQYRFDLNEKAANQLIRWSDFVGFANKNIGVTEEKSGFNKKITKGEDLDAETNYLFTKKTPAHPGGGRDHWGQLPPEIPLYWESFMEEVQALLEPPAPKKKVSAK
jgi:hypothetical protein